MQAVPLYSPFPPEVYSRSDGSSRAGIGYMLRSPAYRALWNLYWLSEPRVDEFLNGGPSSLLDMKMYVACRDALEQTVGGAFVRELVTSCNAAGFARALREAPHTHLAPYELRGYPWLHVVLKRSEEVRRVLKVQDNIIYASFGRRAV